MSVTIKTKKEIDLLRIGGKQLSRALYQVVRAARPGVTTIELDQLAEELIIKTGGVPAFKGYQPEGTKIPFSGTICTSINNAVVHGVPNEQVLQEGDVLGIDIGMRWPENGQASSKGLYTDMAVTVGIGKISKEAKQLLEVTKNALALGIGVVRSGAHIGDIGNAIETELKRHHYGIVRDLSGHGVGYELHEDPYIPNYGKAGTGIEIAEGMVLAIEPMAMIGKDAVRLDSDGWTFKTADGSLAAHFEQTIAVTKNGSEILTPHL